jgi:hypothetical protein
VCVRGEANGEVDVGGLNRGGQGGLCMQGESSERAGAATGWGARAW